MGRTTFSGPIRTGRNVGIPGQNTIGTVYLMQEATVTNAAKKNQLQMPADCLIDDFLVHCRVAVSVLGSASTNVNIRLGTSADATRYGAILVSAAGVYRSISANTSVRALGSGMGTGDFNILAVDSTVTGSAALVTDYDAVVKVLYHQIP